MPRRDSSTSAIRVRRPARTISQSNSTPGDSGAPHVSLPAIGRRDHFHEHPSFRRPAYTQAGSFKYSTQITLSVARTRVGGKLPQILQRSARQTPRCNRAVRHGLQFIDEGPPSFSSAARAAAAAIIALKRHSATSAIDHPGVREAALYATQQCWRPFGEAPSDTAVDRPAVL